MWRRHATYAARWARRSATMAFAAEINSYLAAKDRIKCDDLRPRLGSDALLGHIAYDRLEVRLRKLDDNGVRKWAGSWAEPLLSDEKWAAFRTPYASPHAPCKKKQSALAVTTVNVRRELVDPGALATLRAAGKDYLDTELLLKGAPKHLCFGAPLIIDDDDE